MKLKKAKFLLVYITNIHKSDADTRQNPTEKRDQLQDSPHTPLMHSYLKKI